MHKHTREDGKEGKHQPRWDFLTRLWSTDGTRKVPCIYPNCAELLEIGTVKVKKS